MIVHENIVQGSAEWFALKIGKLSTSNFGRAMSNGRGTDSMGATATTYAKDLAIERLTGVITEFPETYHMERGTKLEPEARKYYEETYFDVVTEIGGIENHGFFCSTDGLIGDDKVLEIKCPKASNHFDYLLDNSKFINKYKPQIQGELWLSERKICIFVSYHPDFNQQVVLEIPRDEDYIQKLVRRTKLMEKTIKEYVKQIQNL